MSGSEIWSVSLIEEPKATKPWHDSC